RARLTDPGRVPVGWHETSDGWTLVNHVPGGLSRLITFEFDGPPLDHRAPLTGTELAESAARIHGRPIPFEDLVYAGRFSDFSRVADVYGAGRLLIAGDAAHIHYPVGGQGLGLGIQDAFNLGWKLAAVVGGADPRLLETYTRERRPHAERVIAYTRDQAAAMRPDAIATAAEQAHRAAILDQVGSAAGRARIADLLSSQWVRTARGTDDAPAVGTFATDRPVRTAGGPTRLSALLAGGRALLLGAPTPSLDDLARPWRDRVDVVHDLTAGAAPHTLVRPDGYIAWQGDVEADGLERALECWFGPPERQPALTTTHPGPSRLDSTRI
ncbi:MAG: FAD-dependent monooxygenase, partial [Patulibacter sp.]|nr:FAD-dependent monooxygenase [Patulibacter sp.]